MTPNLSTLWWISRKTGEVSMIKFTVAVYLPLVMAICTAADAQTSSDRVDVHIAAAKAAAQNDLQWLYQSTCGRLETAITGQDAGQSEEEDYEWNKYYPPTKVFDNLYYVGSKHVSTWAITTSEGIILIDAQYETSVKNYVVEGLRKLGLNAADIKYVVVTHGHHDHYGGAHYLQKQFNAQIVLTAADWDIMLNDPEELPKTQGKPTREIIAFDGQKLTLGDTTLTLILTPGHTPGVISLIIPINDQGRPHVAILRGSLGRSQESIDAFTRFADLAARARADVVLSNHPGSAHSIEYMDALMMRKPGEPHAFVLGTDGVNRYTQIVEECAKANLLNR